MEKKCFPRWRPVHPHLVEVGVVGPTVLREEANPVAKKNATMYARTAVRGGGKESEAWKETSFRKDSLPGSICSRPDVRPTERLLPRGCPWDLPGT